LLLGYIPSGGTKFIFHDCLFLKDFETEFNFGRIGKFIHYSKQCKKGLKDCYGISLHKSTASIVCSRPNRVIEIADLEMFFMRQVKQIPV
jgi:hypothetical protein